MAKKNAIIREKLNDVIMLEKRKLKTEKFRKAFIQSPLS